MCRSIWLTYQETVDVQGEFFYCDVFSSKARYVLLAGQNALRFSPSASSTWVNNTHNFCYCDELADLYDDPCIKTTENTDEINISECGITTCYDGIIDVSEVLPH